MRDWIFVLLGKNWYDREMSWKLNQSSELFDMKNAPFTEPLVPADTKDTEALAARQRLQNVLNQLNPAPGKMDGGGGRLGKLSKKNAGATGKQPDEDNQNANAGDQ